MSETAARPAFTLGQHHALQAWSAGRPRGFRHVVLTCYEMGEEVAEITQRSAREHLYRIIPAAEGTVTLEATGDDGLWTLETVEAALAEVLAIEAELEVGWIADPDI